MQQLDTGTIAALAQTVVLTVTLLIFILQFRSQEKAVKDAAYQKVLDDYNDVVRTLVERPELNILLDELVKAGPVTAQQSQQLSAEDKVVRSYYLMVYGLLERAYILYEKRWIDAGAWQEWETWLADLAKRRTFIQIHSGTKGMFNRSFQDHVSRFVKTAPEDAARNPK